MSTYRPGRSLLLSLLSEACELEHALACSYLFAAFSLKNGQTDGLDWRQEQLIKRWAAQVYFIAGQEMLHLAQAWNLLNAVGGTPYFSRPPFPQPRDVFPVGVPLVLARYCPSTLERFKQWERPTSVLAQRGFVPTSDTGFYGKYRSVGELYDKIAGIIQTLPTEELFVGNAALQVDGKLADFPDLVRVVDRESALLGVARIQAQGEGSPKDREDCHFGLFCDLADELAASPFNEPGLPAAHPTVDNPCVRPTTGGTRIVEPATAAAMRLFDSVYAAMLRLLGWVFGPAEPEHAFTQRAARAGIAAMPIVIKPLGEALASLTAGLGNDSTAGAPSSSIRHLPLPADADVARRLSEERFGELVERATSLLAEYSELNKKLAWLPDRLRAVQRILVG
jgi:Ferritin-like